ncbi:MAG: DNA translocase FtsK [Candidatus Dependentiae bacterium]|nr:DNA translocase FtsK [Candidatus Dependentiae bacterium]
MFKFRSKTVGALSYKQDLIACLLIAAALFVAVAVFSHNAHDSSWFYYTNMPNPTRNLGGILGAHVSAFLLYLFGASALLLAGLLFFIAYLVLTRISYKQEWERLGASGLLLFVCAALCSLYHIDFFGAQFPGGLLGDMVRKHMATVFGVVGGGIFLHMLLLICFILLTRFSFMLLVQALMRGVRVVLSKSFLLPVGRFLYKLGVVVVMPIAAAARFIKKMYDGAVLTDDDYSVTDFERDLLASADYGAIDSSFFDEQATENHSMQTMEHVYTAGSMKAEVQHDIMSDIVYHVPTETHLFDDVAFEEPAADLVAEEDDGMLEPIRKDVTSKPYRLPQDGIFTTARTDQQDTRSNRDDQRSKILEEKLERFGVYGTVTSIKSGPVVTLFEYQPNIDTKVSKIVALEDDLAMALQALSIRIIAPIPGRSVVGFEVANKQRHDVLLAHTIYSSAYKDFKGALPVILGQDTVGNHVVVDLVRMPHLLVAGSTGSGKSVALNTMLISLLCKCKPAELRLMLIDPKRLEFASYADIPHLIFPIITDAKRATMALRWVVKQMEERYELMAGCGARNIFDYNAMVGLHEKATEPMPYIVVIIDELADLMMTAGRDIEDLIARITQMARAAGIHMVVATQRPSVDVITGLIKVNFPSRISFRVTSKIDSRTILDCGGADKLLGRGDMLFLDAAGSLLRRVHGAYVSDKEINDVVAHARAEQPPHYLHLAEQVSTGYGNADESLDQIYHDVLIFLKEIDEVSISLLQRKFRIGFNRSARIIEQLEQQGLIMSADGGKTRKVIH